MATFFNSYGLLFFVPLGLTIVVTPMMSSLARRLDFVDRPGRHKTHENMIPLLGGLAIYISIFVAMLFFSSFSTKLITGFIGALILVITGLLDDAYNLKPPVKLAGQITAAAVVVLFHPASFQFFINYMEDRSLPGVLALLLVIGFIVLMINALNIIDGLDGLAAGTAAIVFMAMALIGSLVGSVGSLITLQIVAAGACAGFLIYNFQPARIYMGDTGSMLLGYLLATSYLMSLQGVVDGSLILGTFFIFGYPALDISYAIIRRLWRRSSIFKADQGHIHHILIRLGFSVRQSVLLLYSLSIVFAGLAVFLLSVEISSAAVVAIGLVTALITMALFRILTLLSRKKEAAAVFYEGAGSDLRTKDVEV